MISDLLDDPEQTLEALKLLRGMKNELIVFHLLDREEIDFPFNQLMEFEDMETGGRMIIDCEAVRRAYRARLDEFVGRLERECTGAGIDYLRVNTAETFHELLAGYILKRGMLRR